jgi:hypothetical protein
LNQNIAAWLPLLCGQALWGASGGFGGVYWPFNDNHLRNRTGVDTVSGVFFGISHVSAALPVDEIMAFKLDPVSY